MLRSISGIFAAKKVNMGCVFLDQALPISGLERIDPFLLIHHWDRPLKGGQKQNEVGVGPHPHRGYGSHARLSNGENGHFN